MNFRFVSLHRSLFAYLALTLAGFISLSFNVGELKPYAEIDFIDVAAEGGLSLMILVWILFILLSRPKGKVTNFLFTGLLLMHVTLLLDFLDEFIDYPNAAWFSPVESIPALLGMFVMTFALYLWHQEQNIINNQLRRTERYYREHTLTDITTGLNSADYIKKQIQDELNNENNHQVNFSLILFDIKHFSKFNDKYGAEHGDTLLREVAQIILMSIRNKDLACRYASDRFIVLLPQTAIETAEAIALQAKKSIEHLAYKSGNSSKAIYSQVKTCSQHYRGWHTYEEVLADINQQLSQAKTSQYEAKFA